MIITGDEIDMTPNWDDSCDYWLTAKAEACLNNLPIIYTEKDETAH